MILTSLHEVVGKTIKSIGYDQESCRIFFEDGSQIEIQAITGGQSLPLLIVAKEETPI
jgi:hypothetical protein